MIDFVAFVVLMRFTVFTKGASTKNCKIKKSYRVRLEGVKRLKI